MAPKAKWTILTYIAAHNNLHFMGKRSYDQIIAVGSTPEVRHGILFDWPDGAARYIAGEPGLVEQQEQLGNYDSGDPERLIETAQWVFNRYPAERYGLVLWSHGSGWQPSEIETVARKTRGDDQVDKKESVDRSGASGSLVLFRTTLSEIVKPDDRHERSILFDDGTGHSLDTLELEKVTRSLRKSIGQPIDLLGMDACLMATLEVGYQVRSSVRYLVASEELVPGHSWPYDIIFGELRGHPQRTSAEVAISVVKEYTDYYAANPPGAGDVTKVALDLGHIKELAEPISGLATALADDMDNQADLLWKVQVETEKKESRNGQRQPNKFSYHLWDIRAVAARLVDLTANPAVRDAAQAVVQALRPAGPAVLAEGHSGPWFAGIGGVSIFMMPPKKQERISPFYARLALSTDTTWAEMLRKYHAYYP
jgi:hypothetical protein